MIILQKIRNSLIFFAAAGDLFYIVSVSKIYL
jgi:hypothetical protein